LDPNNLALKHLTSEVSIDYCEIQAKILIDHATQMRKNKDEYQKLLNEAAMFLIFAKVKNAADKIESKT